MTDRAWLQSEYNEIDQFHALIPGGVKYFNRRDEGVAVNYAFSPQCVLKAEYHEQTFGNLRITPIFTPTGLAFDVGAVPFEGSYGMLSLSLSF